MIARAILPLLCLLLWGFFALAMRGQQFSSPDQAFYYSGLPTLLACAAIVLLLLSNVRYARIAVQILAVLMLLALPYYLLFYTGGM